jgi:hypothetical protein
MAAHDLAQILRDAGLTVSEVGGWHDRGHPGMVAFQGGLWHHTAGLKDLDVVVNGRAGLAGPLANLFLDRAGVFHVVAAGVAWHAGPGSATVLANLQNDIAPKGYAADLSLPDDCSVGNHFLLGIEVESIGDHEPYPPAQVEALVLGSAALCEAYGWTENRWAHHREWTARKVDMDLADSLQLRPLVGAALAAPVPPTSNGGADMAGIVIFTTAAGPNHRPAAISTPDKKPRAEYLGGPEWSAYVHASKANPAAVAIVPLSTKDHDALTGGPK